MKHRPEKILVRGVNWLGDAVMTTPALRRLREAKPHARIELLTHAKLADLWRGHPCIDATLTFTDRDSMLGVARLLRAQDFDAAIVFPNSPRSALEVFFARIPLRAGYARAFRSVFLTRAVPPRADAVKMHKRSASDVNLRIVRNCTRDTFPSRAHHVHDYLHLVGASDLGAKSDPLPALLHVGEDEVSAARKRMGPGNGPVLALNPGAEYGPAKRWPAERFVEAARQLHEELGCNWVILGGKGDQELAGRIGADLTARIGPDRVVNLAGQTSLRELCATLKASALLLTNDSGPMHVAAALGTPVVVPFGSTSPELTGPVMDAQSLHYVAVGAASCAPCFRRECPVDFRCMQSIPATDLVRGALRSLARAPA